MLSAKFCMLPQVLHQSIMTLMLNFKFCKPIATCLVLMLFMPILSSMLSNLPQIITWGETEQLIVKASSTCSTTQTCPSQPGGTRNPPTT